MSKTAGQLECKVWYELGGVQSKYNKIVVGHRRKDLLGSPLHGSPNFWMGLTQEVVDILQEVFDE
jgi:hypothetical protein